MLNICGQIEVGEERTTEDWLDYLKELGKGLLIPSTTKALQLLRSRFRLERKHRQKTNPYGKKGDKYTYRIEGVKSDAADILEGFEDDLEETVNLVGLQYTELVERLTNELDNLITVRSSINFSGVLAPQPRDVHKSDSYSIYKQPSYEHTLFS